MKFFIVVFLLFTSLCYADKIDARVEWGLDRPEYLKYVENIHKRNSNDRTPLLQAAEFGKYNICKTLIEKGAKVNVKDNIDFTPLHYAALEGYLDIAKLLIEKGAKVNAKGGIQVTGQLFSKGAKRKLTPLHLAAERGHLEIVKLLLEHGAKINAESFDSTTPLHEAVNSHKYKIVEFLISKGANININANFNFDDAASPLHSSIRNEGKDIIKLLISCGANIVIKNNKSKTPLEYAKEFEGRRSWAILILEKAQTPEVQALIKEGKKEEVIKILTETEKSTPSS